jgi:hypothetical protein
MPKTINDLVGAIVLNIIEVHDYIQIVTNKFGINIYNPFKLYIKDDENSVKIQKRDLINTIITSIEFRSEEYFCIEMDNKKILETSLLEKDYSGPEAFDIHFISGEIIVN